MKNKWSRSKIINEIKRIKAEGESINFRDIKRKHRNLFDSAFHSEYFGSWAKAVVKAGFKNEYRFGRRWNKKKIVGAVRDLYAKYESFRVII
jgi:hypothetical protein